MQEHHVCKLLNINGQELYTEHHTPFAGKPTVIFLHDSLGCVQLWREFPQRLSEATQCNILVYDRLGYGKSAPMPTHERPVNYLELEAEILAVLMDELDIKDAILFGHSDGGSIALIAAAKHPTRIKAVVCEAAHIFVEEVTLKGIREAIKSYAVTNLPRRLQKYHGDKTDTLFKAWTETWTRSDFRSWSVEHLLNHITCPLLFIQGEADEFGTLDQLHRTVGQISGRAESCIIPDAGHTPHKEAADATLAAAKAFIETLRSV